MRLRIQSRTTAAHPNSAAIDPDRLELRRDLLARQILIGREDHAAFQATFDSILDLVGPIREPELLYVEEMVSATWRLRRLWGVESEMMLAVMDQKTQPDQLARMTASFGDLAATPQLGLIQRHQSRLEASYQRALYNLLLGRHSGLGIDPLNLKELKDEPKAA